MAWDSKGGELKSDNLSDDEYWRLFNFVFSDQSRKTTSYKFAFIKAVLDNLLNNASAEGGEQILYSDLFAKFAESFWNLVVKFHLCQSRRNSKNAVSKIERIFNAAVQKNPILASVEFASIDSQTKARLVKDVQNECKKYVLGALYGDFSGSVFSFEERGDKITLSRKAYEFLLKYKMEIERLNYYAWAKFLESVNAENVLFKILTKLELSLPERRPLDIYRNILFKEFEECNCFYCGKKLSEKIHVDHFIPWSFVKEDKLWNFVLSCPECNIKKSNALPPRNLIPQIQSRNRIIIGKERALKNDAAGNNFIAAQFKNYDENLIPKLWRYAKYAGFRTMAAKMYFINPDFGKRAVADSGDIN